MSNLPPAAGANGPDEMPPLSGSDPRSATPAGRFAAAMDAALTAILPVAVEGERNRAVWGAIPGMEFNPAAAPQRTDMTTMEQLAARRSAKSVVSPQAENAQFAGLASALAAFQDSVRDIDFPPDCRDAASDVLHAAEHLRLIANQHATVGDVHRPSDDSRAAHQFIKAVNRWEGKTARLAGKLGL